MDAAVTQPNPAVLEQIEATIMDALRRGEDHVRIEAARRRPMAVLMFAMTVFYGVTLEGFEPTPADEAAVCAAIVAVDTWQTNRGTT
jgi:hypothetical protein